MRHSIQSKGSRLARIDTPPLLRIHQRTPLQTPT
jgi:hypothetical protein